MTPFDLVASRDNASLARAIAAEPPAASEDTLNFALLKGVRPMIETYPLEKAGAAYERMMSGKAQFRVVLTM